MIEMRTYDMLSSYAISEQGRVIELDTMDFVQLTSQDNYKLLTDEEVYLETKNKTIKLWRRFTVEDIIKMYNSPKAKPFSESPTSSITIGTSAPLNAQVYKSISEASAQLGINRRTIKKRLDDPLNTDYIYLED